MGRNLTNLPISASFQYLLQVSGSEVNDGLGNDVDLLTVTASHALNADFATTASFATFAGGAVDVDAIYTASYSNPNLTFEKGDGSSFDVVISTTVDTGSLMETGSVSDATLTFTKADASTFDLTVDNVANATSATTATTADTASYVAGANVDGAVTLATTATTATTANTASYVAGANVDGTVASATSASHAITADTASFLPADTNLNISTISASFGVFQSASIGYLQQITGSAKIIGDAYIILNNDTPTERYAGIIVQDSGSTNNTASFEFDGQTNDWFYEYTDDGGATQEFGVVMFGPGYNTRGAHVYPSNNTILKGTGDHHIVDSIITDDGSTVTVAGDISASVIEADTYFAGDLIGNASTATSASHAIIADSALTANTATSASFASSGNGIFSGSFSGSFTGDGSGLIGVDAGGLVAGSGTNSMESAASLTATPATASANRTIALGNNATATAEDAVAIGADADASSADAVAIGFSARAADGSAISIGQNSDATEFCTVAIGASARAQGDNAVSIGRSCQSSAQDSIGIGQRANRASGATGAAALGSYTDADNAYGTAIGYGAQATGSLAMEFRVNQLPLISATTASQDVTFYGGAHFTDKVTGDVGSLSIASTTASMDCSAGNFFTLTLANGVDTHLDATNITAGQTINLKVTNNATGAGTISFAPEFEFVDGTAFEVTATTSAVDVITFVSFDGTSLQATGLKNFS